MERGDDCGFEEEEETTLLTFLKAFDNLPDLEVDEELLGGSGDCNPLKFIASNTTLLQRVREYIKWEKNPKSLHDVMSLIKKEDVNGLKSLLEDRLSFGTAGLRGKMGPGFNAMNDLVIIQTSQGFVRYLESVFGMDTLRTRGVIIGYDARHNSSRFAILTANAFIQRGHLVRLFSHYCPTPFIPFAVQKYGASAGVMVTASHNPKEDNGYKVYWDNGAQIISPHDKGIQSQILENLEPWEDAWVIDAVPLYESRMILDPWRDVLASYCQAVVGQGLGHNHARNEKSNLQFVYTPMHGVGYDYIVAAFEAAGLKPVIPVEEQKLPDPEFPTVRFPNPEEGKSALNLAIQTANSSGCSIILANDPDADRLAVAEKLPSGDWKIFNGNELGALLGWWCMENWVREHDKKTLRECVMISSTVSSKILKTMADREGFTFRETLTGFKWMANLADDLTKTGYKILFAFEEAIGFMIETSVLDKDGISAAVRLAEMAVELDSKHNMSLHEQLEIIYTKYGYHTSQNSYFLCHEPKTIVNMFNYIRGMEVGNYPTQLMNGKYKINRVRDLTTGYDSSESDHKAKLPVSKGSQMLTFYFDNGLVATLRTSGTEPKIKYYTELCAKPEERDWNKVQDTLKEMVGAIISEWIQPAKWGLTSIPDHDEEER